jgi:hypothetical protein
MDIIDQANDQAEAMLEAQRQHRKPRMSAIGTCYSCDELLPRVGQLFCDKDCQADYEHEQRLLSIQGRAE